MRKSTQRSAKGFTLVELMLVVAILAIVATVAMPSFTEVIESQRMKGAATDLMIVLTRARSEAIKRNTNVTLSPKAGDWANGWQLPDPTSGALIDDHGTIPGITISGPGSVVYQGSGRVQGSSAPSFAISGSVTSSVRCVAVDLSGRPSVKAGSC